MSALDPENLIIRLCIAGMEAEQQGCFGEAKVLYEQAWRQSTDDVERCIAAHHVARQQDTLDKALWWNQLALHRADAARDTRVHALYPSLHLGLGKAFEDLEQVAAAHHHYERARASLTQIDDPAYRKIVEDGVIRSLERTSSDQLGSTEINLNQSTRGTPHN